MAVERHTLLARPRKDGKSLYEHFEKVAETLGKWPEGYEPIPPPEELNFLWDTYWEFRNTAQSGFNGPVRISFLEIDAWERVRGYKLGNFVVDVILAMDTAYISEWYRKRE